MEILVDETNDGWDIKLKLLGFEAKSVKKLKEKEQKLGHDFNIIHLKGGFLKKYNYYILNYHIFQKTSL